MCTEDSPSGLWRTLGKRVGCKPSGVRIPHPPPPDPGTASGSGVFVVWDAAGVPGTGGPGRCVCRWAAARPRAVRAASFARRVGSKPGQATMRPNGAAASFRWGRPVVMCRASSRLRAWGENVYAGAGPPRDGIIRTSPGQECSKDKGALPGARRIFVYAARSWSAAGCISSMWFRP